MIIDMFRKKKKYSTIHINQSNSIPVKQEGVLKKKTSTDIKVKKEIEQIKCPKCGNLLKNESLKFDLNTCSSCNFHSRINPRTRIKNLVDQGSFVEMDIDIKSSDPLEFPDYKEKLDKASRVSKETEGVVTGVCKIHGSDAVIAVMNPYFMMGSMGSVVGEKLTRAIECGINNSLPVIIFSASGGARMQEGILSLMQMAKTSAALSRLSDKGLLYLSVLTDPTTGGVTASFAMLGDLIIAEPGALIGFAGPRVIEQTIRQKLPEEFQRSEFLKEKGFVDKIVHRKDMRNTIGKILNFHTCGGC